MESASSFLIANTVGSILCQKLNINAAYSSSIGVIVLSLISAQKVDVWLLSLAAIGTLMFLYVDPKWLSAIWSRKTVKITIYNGRETYLIDYMDRFPEFFDKKYDARKGLPNEANSDNQSYHTSLDHPQTIHFDDKNFNVRGYITTESITISKKHDKAVEASKEEAIVPVLHVYANPRLTASQYYWNILKRIEDMNASSNALYINYSKMCSFKEGVEYRVLPVSFRLYKGTKDDKEKLFEEYMTPFFHQEKNGILEHVMKVAYEPEFFFKMGQFATANYLLEGPAGTGKSTFAYRLALATMRDISSIDVSVYSSKFDLYRKINDVYDTSIILLEEFDIAINNLSKRSRQKKRITSSDIPELKTKDSGYISWMEDFRHSKQDITIEDLLELLQGPAPRNGQIIIATTNKYDEIRTLCPALFRPGRLTPVHFGYLNCAEVNKMGKFYFGSEHKDIDFDPEISSAELVEYATTAKLKNDPVYFYQKIRQARTITSQ